MSVAAGGSGGRKGGGLPPKIPDDRPGGDEDDDYDEDDDPDYTDREFCNVCNKYLRVGQDLETHKKKFCVGPRDFVGDYPCRFPRCASRYRHYHDLQAHWRKQHPGAVQTKAMKKYIP